MSAVQGNSSVTERIPTVRQQWYGTPVTSPGERIAVIGNGNVAMDVVRLIAKSEEELAGSDINDVARKTSAQIKSDALMS